MEHTQTHYHVFPHVSLGVYRQEVRAGEWLTESVVGVRSGKWGAQQHPIRWLAIFGTLCSLSGSKKATIVVLACER